MDDWQLFTDPRFTLRFRYPSLIASGETVDRQETQQAGVIRVHILAPESREVYFEVSKYAQLTPLAEYRRHKEHLLARFEALAISGLREVQRVSVPAYEYSFAWEKSRRVVLVVERVDALYRIIYDPRSAVNLQILSTLKWVDVT